MYYSKQSYLGVIIICDDKNNIICRVNFSDYDTDDEAIKSADFLTDKLNNINL
jgi:hypothetical protein